MNETIKEGQASLKAKAMLDSLCLPIHASHFDNIYEAANGSSSYLLKPYIGFLGRNASTSPTDTKIYEIPGSGYRSLYYYDDHCSDTELCNPRK